MTTLKTFDILDLKKLGLNSGSNTINDEGRIVKKNTNTPGWYFHPTKGLKKR